MTVAFVLWVLSTVCAVLAIPAPNGFPLLLLAFVLYGLAWCFYKPKGIR